MATKQDKELVKKLRAGGVRKKVARLLTKSTRSGSAGNPPRVVGKTIDNLRSAADELEGRVRHSQRSGAGKKAARTRKHKAAERSAAARKGARTRARRG
jgi:hypothetical protein